MDKKHTIMIIEDEPLLLSAISKKLDLTGLETVSCAGGEQALDYLANLPKTPDLIWLDYYLKDMNGLEFVTKVKESENWKSIPIMVVSNSASPDKVHHMLGLGVQKYFLKAQYRLDDLIKIAIETIESEGEK